MFRTLFVVTLACGFAAPAAAQSWAGPGSDWNTAANWSPAVVPNSPTANVLFAGGTLGNVNISSSVQAQSLSFTIASGSYDITGNAGATLGGLTTINVGPAVSTQEFVSLPTVGTGSLVFPGGSNLTITNSSTAAATTLVLYSTTVIGTPGLGGVVVNGPGNTQIQAGFASGSGQVVGGLTKNGPGTLLLSNDGTNLKGGLTLNGGTLALDYFVTPAVKLGGSGSLTLGGGLLAVYGNSVTNVTQNIPGGTVINAGQTDIQANFNGSGTVTLNLNGLTRSVGGTVDVSPGNLNSGFAVNTSAISSNGLILGPGFITVNGGAGWGSLAGTQIYPFTGYNVNVFNQASSNTDVTQSSTQSSISVNSLRFNTPNVSLLFSGSNSIQSGGILVTGNAFGTSIYGGTLVPSGSNELIAHVYGDLSLYSQVSSSAGLTKTGPGLLKLGGLNTGLTGPINVNRGSLTATAAAAITNASQINFNDARSGSDLQQLTVDLGNNGVGAIAPPIRLSASSPSGFYGTWFSTGNSTNSVITLQGVISSAPGQTTPIRFTGSPTNTSEIDLTNANTFTGNVSLYQGSLGLSSDAALGNAANVLTLEVGSTTAGGLVFLLANPINHAVVLASPTRIVCNTGNFALVGPISGPSFLYKAGNGGLTLSGANTYTGGTNVTNGTVYVAADSALGTGDVTVGAFGNLYFTGMTSTTKNFVLGGGNLTAAANQMVTFNGGQISGGFLGGAGAFATGLTTGAQFANMTTRPAVSLISNNGLDQFSNMNNGGAFSVSAGVTFPVTLNGFTNQGSGSVTIGPGSKVNGIDFQSYGTLTLNPGPSAASATRLTNSGASPMYFNGGSRTFIGTPQTAGQNLALVDLHGENAIVAGGLLVNNGFVGDSTQTGATLVADFGGLVKGAGTFANPVITQNGGKFQAGNSPGRATFGSFVFGPGGVDDYILAMNNATGTAGPSPDAAGHVSGWGLVNSTGDFTWTATPDHKLTVALETLVNPTVVGTDNTGLMDNFDPTQAYSWPAVQWSGTYAGPSNVAVLNAATHYDTTGFENPIGGVFGWNLEPAGHTLSLTYTPVPEPGTVAMAGLAAAGLFIRRFRIACPKR